jgi:hypothetical protein
VGVEGGEKEKTPPPLPPPQFRTSDYHSTVATGGQHPG